MVMSVSPVRGWDCISHAAKTLPQPKGVSLEDVLKQKTFLSENEVLSLLVATASALQDSMLMDDLPLCLNMSTLHLGADGFVYFHSSLPSLAKRAMRSILTKDLSEKKLLCSLGRIFLATMGSGSIPKQDVSLSFLQETLFNMTLQRTASLVELFEVLVNRLDGGAVFESCITVQKLASETLIVQEAERAICFSEEGSLYDSKVGEDKEEDKDKLPVGSDFKSAEEERSFLPLEESKVTRSATISHCSKDSGKERAIPRKPPRVRAVSVENLGPQSAPCQKGRQVLRAPSKLYKGSTAESFPPGHFKGVVGPEFVVQSKLAPKTLTAAGLSGSEVFSKKVTVVLLDGRRIEVSCYPATTKISHIMQILQEEANFPLLHLLGIARLAGGEFHFIPPQMKLCKISPSGWKSKNADKEGYCLDNFVLYLRFIYYLKINDVHRMEDRARHQLYLQLRHDVTEGRLKVPESRLLHLGGLALQAEFGDCKRQADIYFLPEHYVPETILLMERSSMICGQLRRIHLLLAGNSPSQAEAKYISEAQNSSSYGIHWYRTFQNNESLTSEWLGISPRGILVTSESPSTEDSLSHAAVHPWPSVKRISYTSRKISLTVKSPEKSIKLKFPFLEDRTRHIFYLSSVHQSFFKNSSVQGFINPSVKCEEDVLPPSSTQAYPSTFRSVYDLLAENRCGSSSSCSSKDIKRHSISSQETNLPSGLSSPQTEAKSNVEREDVFWEGQNTGSHMHRKDMRLSHQRSKSDIQVGETWQEKRPLTKDFLSDESLLKSPKKSSGAVKMGTRVSTAVLQKHRKKSQESIPEDLADEECITPAAVVVEPPSVRSVHLEETLSESLVERFLQIPSRSSFESCDRRLVSATIRKKNGSLGIMMGVGIDGGLYIQDVSPEGPAHVDGTIRPGDRIVGINGRSVENLSYEKAADLVRNSLDDVTLLVSQPAVVGSPGKPADEPPARISVVGGAPPFSADVTSGPVTIVTVNTDAHSEQPRTWNGTCDFPEGMSPVNVPSFPSATYWQRRLPVSQENSVDSESEIDILTTEGTMNLNSNKNVSIIGEESVNETINTNSYVINKEQSPRGFTDLTPACHVMCESDTLNNCRSSNLSFCEEQKIQHVGTSCKAFKDSVTKSRSWENIFKFITPCYTLGCASKHIEDESRIDRNIRMDLIGLNDETSEISSPTSMAPCQGSVTTEWNEKHSKGIFELDLPQDTMSDRVLRFLGTCFFANAIERSASFGSSDSSNFQDYSIEEMQFSCSRQESLSSAADHEKLFACPLSEEGLEEDGYETDVVQTAREAKRKLSCPKEFDLNVVLEPPAQFKNFETNHNLLHSFMEKNKDVLLEDDINLISSQIPLQEEVTIHSLKNNVSLAEFQNYVTSLASDDTINSFNKNTDLLNKKCFLNREEKCNFEKRDSCPSILTELPLKCSFSFRSLSCEKSDDYFILENEQLSQRSGEYEVILKPEGDCYCGQVMSQPNKDIHCDDCLESVVINKDVSAPTLPKTEDLGKKFTEMTCLPRVSNPLRLKQQECRLAEKGDDMFSVAKKKCFYEEARHPTVKDYSNGNKRVPESTSHPEKLNYGSLFFHKNNHATKKSSLEGIGSTQGHGKETKSFNQKEILGGQGEFLGSNLRKTKSHGKLYFAKESIQKNLFPRIVGETLKQNSPSPPEPCGSMCDEACKSNANFIHKLYGNASHKVKAHLKGSSVADWMNVFVGKPRPLNTRRQKSRDVVACDENITSATESGDRVTEAYSESSDATGRGTNRATTPIDPTQLTSLDLEADEDPRVPTMLVTEPSHFAGVGKSRDHNHNQRLRDNSSLTERASKYIVDDFNDRSLVFHDNYGVACDFDSSHAYDAGYGSERSPEDDDEEDGNHNAYEQLQESHSSQDVTPTFGEVQELPLTLQHLMRVCPFINEASVFEVTVMKNSRGLGMALTGGIECDTKFPGLIRIKKLYPQTSAWICGRFQPGDLILEANGTTLTGLTSHEALEVLRVTNNEVRLKVCRPPVGSLGEDWAFLHSKDDLTVVTTSLTIPQSSRNQLCLSPSLTSYGEVQIELEKVNGSLGFTLRKQDNSILGHTIRSLVKEPAISDGRLRSGDKILSVNGTDMCGLTHEEAIAFLRTCPDTVTLRLYRDAVQTPISPASPTEPKLFTAKPKLLRKEARDMLEFRKNSSPGNSSNSTGTARRRRLQKTPSPDIHKTAEKNSSEGSLKDLSMSSSSSSHTMSSESSRPKRPNFLDLNATPTSSRKTKFTPPHESSHSFPSPHSQLDSIDSVDSAPQLASSRSDNPTFGHYAQGYQSVNLGTLYPNEDTKLTNTSSDHNLSGHIANAEPKGGLLKWKGIVFTPDEEVDSAIGSEINSRGSKSQKSKINDADVSDWPTNDVIDYLRKARGKILLTVLQPHF